MPESVIQIAGVLAILMAAGLAIGRSSRNSFSVRWLLVAAALVFLNDAALTNLYGTLPNLLPASEWNWQGKILALLVTLAVAALSWFGWRKAGITLAQAQGSLRACLPAAIAYCLFFAAIALVFGGEEASAKTVAFQLTMPSLEEELFYRGLLLLALDRTFTARIRFAGVEWGWGAVLSCLAFGLAHALSYSNAAGFSLDPAYMALTFVPSFLAVWMRLRTGSVLLPVLLHSVGNSLPLIL